MTATTERPKISGAKYCVASGIKVTEKRMKP